MRRRRGATWRGTRPPAWRGAWRGLAAAADRDRVAGVARRRSGGSSRFTGPLSSRAAVPCSAPANLHSLAPAIPRSAVSPTTLRSSAVRRFQRSRYRSDAPPSTVQSADSSPAARTRTPSLPMVISQERATSVAWMSIRSRWIRAQLPARSNRKAAEQLGDAVCRECRRERAGPAGAALCIGSVDACFVRLSACPERQRRRRVVERPAAQIWGGRTQRVDQCGMPGPERGEQRGVVAGPRGQHRILLRLVQGVGSSLRDVCGRPAVDASHMADQVPHAQSGNWEPVPQGRRVRLWRQAPFPRAARRRCTQRSSLPTSACDRSIRRCTSGSRTS